MKNLLSIPLTIFLLACGGPATQVEPEEEQVEEEVTENPSPNISDIKHLFSRTTSELNQDPQDRIIVRFWYTSDLNYTLLVPSGLDDSEIQKLIIHFDIDPHDFYYADFEMSVEEYNNHTYLDINEMIGFFPN